MKVSMLICWTDGLTDKRKSVQNNIIISLFSSLDDDLPSYQEVSDANLPTYEEVIHGSRPNCCYIENERY